MLLSSLLLIVGLSAGTQEAAEVPAAGAPVVDVECPRCDGTGRLVEPCWVCGGDGEHACAACRRFGARLAPRWSLRWTPPALLEAMLGNLELPQLKLGNLPGTRKKAPKAVKPKPGEVACPARCRGGKLLHVEDWVDCGVCRGGKFDCAFCKRGEVKCSGCDGKGEVLGACDDCAGLGRLPALPAAGEPLACPWSGSSTTRACGTCDEEGLVQLACQECYGQLEVACGRCHGLEVIPCKKCGGRGRYGGEKLECEDCGEKGYLTCRACDHGAVVCGTCAGQVAPPVACPDCAGQKQHPCNGCQDSAYAAWESAAARLSARGEHARAVAWLEQAQVRCEARYQRALALLEPLREKQAEQAEEYARVIDAEKQAELRRLERLRKKAEKQAQAAARD